MLNNVDAVYIALKATEHYEYIKKTLQFGKHVLCESPVTIKENQCKELYDIAKNRHLVLFDGIKTAYSTAFNRLILLAKTGVIGKVISIDVTCTSLSEKEKFGFDGLTCRQNSLNAWGPTALLPVFNLFGTKYDEISFISWLHPSDKNYDLFTKINLNYENATASLKVGKGIKSDGSLIISGTKGYIIVGAPWWKSDYFEIHFEDENKTKRYFYQLDDEGIRNELVSFVKSIEETRSISSVGQPISIAIASVIEKFYQKDNVKEIIGDINNEEG